MNHRWRKRLRSDGQVPHRGRVRPLSLCRGPSCVIVPKPVPALAAVIEADGRSSPGIKDGVRQTGGRRAVRAGRPPISRLRIGESYLMMCHGFAAKNPDAGRVPGRTIVAKRGGIASFARNLLTSPSGVPECVPFGTDARQSGATNAPDTSFWTEPAGSP